MLLSGAEVAATSVPDKSMTLIPKLAVVWFQFTSDLVIWLLPYLVMINISGGTFWWAPPDNKRFVELGF